jgi:hypothetical protein
MSKARTPARAASARSWTRAAPARAPSRRVRGKRPERKDHRAPHSFFERPASHFDSAESIVALMIWFVYRTHYEGPLSKRIRKLNAPSVLAWFQKAIEKKGKGIEKELGGHVYGFDSLFEEKHDTPKSVAALRDLLEEDLYSEGDIRVDAHSVRVSTDDDEVELAYFFMDDAAVKKKDRVAWLLHDKPRLPEKIGKGKYKPPFEIDALSKTKGEGATYVCLLTFADSESLPGSAHAFQGVRLPELASQLRAGKADEWPFELRVLRAYLEGDDLGAALKKVAAYPMLDVVNGESTRDATTAADIAKLAKGRKADAKKLVMHQAPHAILFSPYVSKAFGHQQWIFFDDLWASANADLASSILRYASGWDPFTDGDDDDDD